MMQQNTKVTFMLVFLRGGVAAIFDLCLLINPKPKVDNSFESLGSCLTQPVIFVVVCRV